MNEKIEPALSAEEYQRIRSVVAEILATRGDEAQAQGTVFEIRTLMALLNSGLDDEDPRKITRTAIENMRSAVRTIELEWGAGTETGDNLKAFADALESYLVR